MPAQDIPRTVNKSRRQSDFKNQISVRFHDFSERFRQISHEVYGISGSVVPLDIIYVQARLYIVLSVTLLPASYFIMGSVRRPSETHLN